MADSFPKRGEGSFRVSCSCSGSSTSTGTYLLTVEPEAAVSLAASPPRWLAVAEGPITTSFLTRDILGEWRGRKNMIAMKLEKRGEKFEG
ncbi:hypothetical protein V1477_009009 [Vespula maculifrons]|uniref:Uncharacterized protein n=2 Tax=Vespula TaxID=7451 RepID=A0A834N195_VESVU|nr:hypothetical protein HZH66_009804 [Vespula vulgaris]